MTGYLLRRLSQVPDDNDWLTTAERQWFTDRRSAKRVADWRLGRWTAKAAVGAFLERRGQPVTRDLEILAAADGAPEAFAGGSALPISLSLSHSHGRALAAVAVAGCELGCDIERIEARSAAFVESNLTADERAALATANGAARDLLVTLIWSAKESALKASRQGLRVDARALEVVAERRSGRPWGRLQVGSRTPAGVLVGRWSRRGDFVLTIVQRPAPEEMVELG